MEEKKSLYLDIYNGTFRKTKALGLFLLPEKNKGAKYHNQSVIEEAEIIRVKYLEELRSGTFSFQKEKSLITYLEESVNGGPRKNSIIKHLQKHLKGKDIPLKEIDIADIERFKEYLQFTATTLIYGQKKKKLKAQTAAALFSAFLGYLKKAQHLGFTKSIDFKAIKNIPSDDAQRQYLTKEELQKLINTPCRESIHKFFLFSCFTGFRTGDIAKLKWEDLFSENGMYRAPFRQEKTGRMLYAYLTPDAIRLIGEPKGKKGLIFEQAKYSREYTNKLLKKWVREAGIDKHITMHCGRHTYATTMISSGVDIYTVSKLLGHTNISTTQIYAQIIDEKKVAACLAFPDFLNKEEAPQQ